MLSQASLRAWAILIACFAVNEVLGQRPSDYVGKVGDPVETTCTSRSLRRRSIGNYTTSVSGPVSSRPGAAATTSLAWPPVSPSSANSANERISSRTKDNALSSSRPSLSASSHDPIIATGSGPAFASSCSNALWYWYLTSSSQAMQPPYGPKTILKSTSWSYTFTPLTGWSASTWTTLCDGHPRVIGSASNSLVASSTFDETYPIKVPASIPNYTNPVPCTIGPSDCKTLWSSWYSATKTSILGYTHVVYEPPCATAASQTSFQSTSCPGNGESALVIGRSAQLLYWPVRIVNETIDHLNGTGNVFCQANYLPLTRTTRATIPGTQTISGKPNTFVTGSMTITSPSVAIQFSGLQRNDGCGPSIDTTFILPPESVNSALGARALYFQYPFDYSDLNWLCQNPSDPSGPYTTQFVEGPDCYQNVPAFAYFYNFERFDAFTAEKNKATLTIANVYRPAVNPNQHLSALLTDVFGPSAAWNIDGIWDPPIALTQEAQAATATLPAYASATPTSVHESLITPAAPGVQNTSPISKTSTTPSDTVYVTVLPDSDPSITQTLTSWTQSSLQPTESADTLSNEGYSDYSGAGGDTAPHPGSNSEAVVTIGSSAVLLSPQASNLVVDGSQTLTWGHVGLVHGQQASWGPSGLVIGTGYSANTVYSNPQLKITNVVIVGTETYDIRSSDGGVDVLRNQQTTLTLSQGGAAATLINGQQVSAAAGSLSIVSSSGRIGSSNDLVTVGTEVLTRTAPASTLQIFSNAQTTFTISPSGSAATINEQTLSASGTGLLIASGGHTSTWLGPNSALSTGMNEATHSSTSTSAETPTPIGTSNGVRFVSLPGSPLMMILSICMIMNSGVV